jgi:probable addiction module antidote protein
MGRKIATKFDAADYLDSPETIAGYLNEALETGDAALMTAAIGDVARAKGMSGIARDAGLSRENLYRALGTEAKPEFSTVVKVLDALGVRLQAAPKPKKAVTGGKRVVR